MKKSYWSTISEKIEKHPAKVNLIGTLVTFFAFIFTIFYSITTFNFTQRQFNNELSKWKADSIKNQRILDEEYYDSRAKFVVSSIVEDKLPGDRYNTSKKITVKVKNIGKKIAYVDTVTYAVFSAESGFFKKSQYEELDELDHDNEMFFFFETPIALNIDNDVWYYIKIQYYDTADEKLKTKVMYFTKKPYNSGHIRVTILSKDDVIKFDNLLKTRKSIDY